MCPPPASRSSPPARASQVHEFGAKKRVGGKECTWPILAALCSRGAPLPDNVSVLPLLHEWAGLSAARETFLSVLASGAHWREGLRCAANGDFGEPLNLLKHVMAPEVKGHTYRGGIAVAARGVRSRDPNRAPVQGGPAPRPCFLRTCVCERALPHPTPTPPPSPRRSRSVALRCFRRRMSSAT
jgi:hypothetical protein